MPYKTGQWGTQQKKRSKKRRAYFSQWQKARRKGKKMANRHLKIKGESIARELLPGSIYVNLSSHDFLHKGRKIEVKLAELHKDKDRGTDSWYFSISNKDQLTCDYFFCIGLNKGTIERLYVIPSFDLKVKKTIHITRNPVKYSKYSQYSKEVSNV